MSRVCAVSFTCLALLMSLPASAQNPPEEFGPAKKKKGPLITVAGFSPESGKVGTEVTIRGTGFTSKTRLLFGGRPVRPTQVRATSITFKVPASFGDGAVVLRHPGVARDVRVGSFAVATTAQITRFAPQSGIRGSRVEISGSGFRRTDRVLMNGKEIEVNRSAPRRIVVTIPKDATADYLTVVSADGGRVRTKAMFKVRLPAPTITAIAPDHGVPGTQVRVSGRNLTAEDVVLYGKTTAKIAGRGAGYIDVIIPPKVKAAGFLSVRNSNGEARAAQMFKLEQPAVVTRITPTFGKVGQKVEIYGRHFRAGDRVMLGDKEVRVVQLRGKQISVIIPEGAPNGPLEVVRGQMRVSSPQKYEVVTAPIIDRLDPSGGKPGARVTLTGRYFSRDASVYYGAKKLRILKRKGDHTLVVQVPKRATEQALRVRTRGGEARSPQTFRVHVAPIITGLSPRTGPPGTRVTISGKNLGSVDAVLLAGKPLTVVSSDAKKLEVEIPLGAASGPIKVQSFGKWKALKYRFKVLAAPEIAGFSPEAGPPGIEIAITGRHFTADTEILFGKTPLEVLRREKGRLTVKMPGIVKPGELYLRARSGASETRSAKKFKVLAPALITGFSPDRVEAGARVTIRGRNFTNATKVFWGKRALKVMRIGPKGRTLEVKIPTRTLGARYLFVDDGGGKARSATMLEVRTPPPKRRR